MVSEGEAAQLILIMLMKRREGSENALIVQVHNGEHILEAFGKRTAWNGVFGYMYQWTILIWVGLGPKILRRLPRRKFGDHNIMPSRTKKDRHSKAISCADSGSYHRQHSISSCFRGEQTLFLP